MSTASQAKIFGVRLGVDPKILILGLIAVAGLLFWYNSRSDETPGGGVSSSNARVAEPGTPEVATPARKRNVKDRRRSSREDRLTLRLQPVSPAAGDIDPVLRMDLLDRLARVKQPAGMRNLFESGPAAMEGGALAVPVRHVTPGPLPTLGAAPPVVSRIVPQVHIPYKYYGFAKPSVRGEANRGFFMEGDDILVAAEGQVLQQKYRIVQLTATMARVEDTEMKQEQTVPLVPEALEQGGTAYGRGNGIQQGMQPGMVMQPGAINPGFPNQSEESQP